jgi:flagellar basal-body rod modification protein FlgD
MATVQTAANSPAAVGQKVDNSRTRLAENFEMFLTLLTTQLKNQDPLSPMDGNQFTQQLVQMTSVEQQLLTNDLLKSIANQGNDDFNKGVDLIGANITSDWTERTLTPSGATWLYELGKDASKAELQIRNNKGDVVWSGPAEGKSKGVHEVTWDGKINGVRAPEGAYKLSVVAKDPYDATITSRVFLEGIVTGVEQKDGAVLLSIGRTLLPLSAVRSAGLPPATEAPAPKPATNPPATNPTTSGTPAGETRKAA